MASSARRFISELIRSTLSSGGSALLSTPTFGVLSPGRWLFLFLPTWLALLIVMAFVLGVAGVLALIGRASLKKGGPPVPELAVHEAKLTKEALKNGAG